MKPKQRARKRAVVGGAVVGGAAEVGVVVLGGAEVIRKIYSQYT